MSKYLDSRGLLKLWNKIKNTFNGKVDKVEGKQLSTEDFTTILKSKLESLTNYDDTELSNKIDALKSRLDTILNSENTTAIIDTFQEIEAFLQGVTNTETLTGLLQEMKNEIVALVESNYVKVEGAKISQILTIEGGKDCKLVFNNTDGEKYTQIQFQENGETHGAFTVNDNDLHWNNFRILNENNYKSVLGGNSSQFVKGDGSLDNTVYLEKYKNISLGPNSGIANGINYIDGANSIISAGCYISSDGDANLKDIKYCIGWGNNWWYSSNSLTIGEHQFTYKDNKIWHAGNDGHGSGLDADTIDGWHIAETPWNSVVLVSGDGVAEIGKYLDFHNKNTIEPDFSCRLQVQGDYLNQVYLPTNSGILALTTDNVFSSKKLSDDSGEYFNKTIFDSLLQRIQALEAKVQ